MAAKMKPVLKGRKIPKPTEADCLGLLVEPSLYTVQLISHTTPLVRGRPLPSLGFLSPSRRPFRAAFRTSVREWPQP